MLLILLSLAVLLFNLFVLAVVFWVKRELLKSTLTSSSLGVYKFESEKVDANKLGKLNQSPKGNPLKQGCLRADNADLHAQIGEKVEESQESANANPSKVRKDDHFAAIRAGKILRKVANSESTDSEEAANRPGAKGDLKTAWYDKVNSVIAGGDRSDTPSGASAVDSTDSAEDGNGMYASLSEWGAPSGPKPPLKPKPPRSKYQELLQTSEGVDEASINREFLEEKNSPLTVEEIESKANADIDADLKARVGAIRSAYEDPDDSDSDDEWSDDPSQSP